MNNVKALFGFKAYSDPKLLNETRTVISFMKDNTNYQNPKPSISDVELAYKEFLEKYVAARNGDRVKIAEKNISRTELLSTMRDLCTYVNITAKNSRIVLLGSGFKISKETKEVRKMGKLKNFMVIQGDNKDEIKVSCSHVINAVSYTFQCTKGLPFESEIVQDQIVTTSKTVFDNLTKGVEYYFRVMVYGRNKQMIESDIKSIICQ